AHLLSRATAMPVNQVEDGAVLVPNHVYVIPPNAAMTLSGLVLALKPRKTAGTTIDAFLRSLAASRKGEAVAVVLSGTGSDGALGLQAISEEGGVVFAQDPESAAFDGMPRCAIATGCVDFVLPPEGIAAELVRIARDPGLMQRDLPELAGPSPGAEEVFQPVLDLLCAGTGIDFSLYRQATVRRRVLRRLALLRHGSLGDYLRHVKENPDELHTLAQDILIRVTRFFRDPEAFEVLSSSVFPALIRKALPDRDVRIWTSGCSTGEEAYSLAISFLEAAELMKSPVSVQVFATDINEAAIEKARRGVYIENIAADVSPERLARFFVHAGREFHVSRKLRDLCIFCRHDLLNDPPFSRMDLVSCRNVLIYLDSMQEHSLSRFHFALNPGGFLLLGRSETAASYPGMFVPLDKAASLYVRQESAWHPAPFHVSPKKASIPHPPEAVSMAARLPRPMDLRGQADQVLAERYGPPRVIVNSALEAVPDAGSRNHELLEAAKQGHADALRNAIRTAGRTGQTVRIERSRDGSIEVASLGLDRQHFLIVFEDEFEPGEPPTADDKGQLEKRIRHLEKELASSRDRLESVVVEQEAANEEVVASNEELQSLNEELSSSKEELEATNEELTTVNQELQVRNSELDRAYEFAQATIDTVRGSLLVLGPDLRVLKANQSFYRTFHVSPSEVGRRFIYELGDGRWSNPRLRELLEEILPKRRSMEDFEIEQEVPPAGRRILLLNARRFERDERILLAIEDVTASRRAEEELRQSQKMEAIGYLAAGVAHDFNNLLTTIMGNASLLLDAAPQDDPDRPALESVVKSAERAADLTRQLLAYAGKARFYLERVDLSEVVIQTARLLHASIPPGVQLRLDLDKHLTVFLADPGQMQQVVTNLVINAVEAIGNAGGAVLVRTGPQTITGEPLPDLYSSGPLVPGEYVFLEVLDNGVGIEPHLMHKIFDPFFTTKFTGRGLGLAAVQGIARSQKGALQVHSVPGRGSSFRVLFPVTEKAASRIAGTVLVVDDEEMIRNFTRSALEQFGYTALLARDGKEGLRMFQERSAEIGLVLLDELETLERIREIRPGVPVIVCPGSGDTDVEARFAGKDIAGFLPKPYTAGQLARKVKECMPPAGAAD
ncbi:MAG: response regulator, partial [Candidatus Solibacter usitatus]|nr:response regulator [Candidatus Solibacter usitatus]